MIAKSLKTQGLTAAETPTVFLQMCQDVLASETSRVGSKTNQNRVKEIVNELVAGELGSSGCGLRIGDCESKKPGAPRPRSETQVATVSQGE